MSNVVSLIARLAVSMDPVDDRAIAALTDVSDDVREALLARDVDRLRTLAGASANVACLVFTPDENDEPMPDRAPDEDEDDPTDSESRAA